MRPLLILTPLLFYAFALHGQVVIANKSLDSYEMTSLLKSAKEGWADVRNCTVHVTRGVRTKTGFDDAALLIPKNITYVSFFECTFIEVELQPEAPGTEIVIANCPDSRNLSVIDVAEVSIRDATIERIETSADSLSMSLTDAQVGEIKIQNNVISSLLIENSTVSRLALRNCTTFSTLDKSKRNLSAAASPFFSSFLRPETNLLGRLEGRGLYDLLDESITIYPNYRFSGLRIFESTITNLQLDKVKFDQQATSVLPIYSSVVTNFLVNGSAVPVLDLFNSTFSNHVIFDDFAFGQVNLYKVDFPASNVAGMEFHKLAKGKIFVFDPDRIERFSRSLKTVTKTDSLYVEFNEYSRMNDTLRFHEVTRYSAHDGRALENEFLFGEVINNYSKLYQVYKLRGDLTSANASYAEMKDLNLARLKRKYHNDPSFKNFFGWQLAWIVKVYTNHGTDPALAITVSFWVICIFAVFYFFFPSDWDRTRKAKMVEDYRIFIEKNDHGYFKPFMKLTSGIVLSFINALTLSLNAYTTLGFGNIPAHGLARYVCVIQGFIGWFMLSIFTVALINQVLT